MKNPTGSIVLPAGGVTYRNRMIPYVKQAGMLAAPFIIYGLFLTLYGVNPWTLYLSMLKSTFGDLYGFGEVLLKAAPFVLTGLAAALPAKAGLVNVGGEGQLDRGVIFDLVRGVLLTELSLLARASAHAARRSAGGSGMGRVDRLVEGKGQSQ